MNLRPAAYEYPHGTTSALASEESLQIPGKLGHPAKLLSDRPHSAHIQAIGTHKSSVELPAAVAQSRRSAYRHQYSRGPVARPRSASIAIAAPTGVSSYMSSGHCPSEAASPSARHKLLVSYRAMLTARRSGRR